jgi:predicted permease
VVSRCALGTSLAFAPGQDGLRRRRPIRPDSVEEGRNMRAVRDVHFAVRNLTRSTGFTIVVVLTLALGIGASTAVFSVVNAVVLRPLDYPQPEQLLRITSELRGFGAVDTGVAAPELLDYQSRTDLFSGVAGILPVSANATGGEVPTRVEMMLVSWNYFSILGVAPAQGRVFEPGDDVPGVANVAVVSDGFWRRTLKADPQALGKLITIDADPVLVVGVMPSGFRHPGRTAQNDVDVWSPSGFRGSATSVPSRGRRRLESCLARLQPGVTFEQAQARLAEYGAAVTRDFPADYPAQSGWRPRLVSLQDSVIGGVSAAMLTLLGGVSLLLLIACINVAHLVLARSSGRRREIAIRQALGARAGQLTRQLLTESALLAAGGGVLGLIVASWTVSGLVALAPERVPRIDSVTIDLAAVAVAVAISFVATLTFGLVPAWQLARLDTVAAVKDGGPVRSTDGRGSRTRDVLVAAEVAMATVLLVGAGLLVRSLIGLVNVPLGFDTDSLTTARITLPRPNDAARATYLDPARRVTFYRETLARIAAIPGIERVAMSTQIPMGGYNPPLLVDVQSLRDPGLQPVLHSFQVSPGYFETMRVRIVRGRTFNEFDRAGSEPVAIVSEAAVRRFWNHRDPIGDRIRLAPDAPWVTVVGVAGDVLNRVLTESPQPILYQTLDQSSGLTLALLIRTRQAIPDLAETIAREVRTLDPELPIYAVRPMADVIGRALAQRQFLMRILVSFGVLAAALALVGIYGVMAYSVSRRTREIGIRMAIGARQVDMSMMVVRRGVALTLAGIATGSIASLALSQFVRSLLYGVEPSDPMTIAAVCLVMTAVAAAAAYLPARRAARVDPVLALRTE